MSTTAPAAPEAAPDYTDMAQQIGVTPQVLEAIDVLLAAGYGLEDAAKLILAAYQADHDVLLFARRFLDVRTYLADPAKRDWP